MRKLTGPFAASNVSAVQPMKFETLQQGKIHIACAPAFSQGFLVDTVKAFRKSRPGVQTVVTTRMTPTIAELATSQQCDLGLAAYAIEPEGTEFETFTDPRKSAFCPLGTTCVKIASFLPRTCMVWILSHSVRLILIRNAFNGC